MQAGRGRGFGGQEWNGGAVLTQGNGCGLENANHLKPLQATGDWFAALVDAIEEVLTFHFQRFLLLDVGDVKIAVMIRILKFSKGVVVRRAIDAGRQTVREFVTTWLLKEQGWKKDPAYRVDVLFPGETAVGVRAVATQAV